MALPRQYTRYIGSQKDYFSHTWAGVPYSTLLGKEFPEDDIDITEETVGTSAPIFLYPLMQTATKIDGEAVGVVTFHNTHVSTAYDLTSYTVTLQKIDASNNPTELKAYTMGTTVNIAADSYQSFQYSLYIDDKDLNTNEKLALKVQLTGDTTQIYTCHGYDNSNSTYDLWIKIPYLI